MNLRKTKYVIGFTLIAIGVAIVVASTLPKSMQYYVTVDELKADLPRYRGNDIKVAGKVIDGTIRKSPSEIEFEMENKGEKLRVFYRGGVPDTFKEGADVVATGRYMDTGDFKASHLLAKCASRYQEKLDPQLNSTPR